MAIGSEPQLEAVWRAAAGDNRAADALLSRLIARYREPHRHYHGVAHLARVVVETDALAREIGAPDRAAVVFAAGFHDAIYDPRPVVRGRSDTTGSTRGRSDNVEPDSVAPDNVRPSDEEASARLASDALRAAGIAGFVANEVARLIRLTGDHLADDGDLAAAALLDADLAVLGGTPAEYEAYRRGVRAEYAHVDAVAWARGRSAVLCRFLDRRAVYRTRVMATAEARARANLTAELNGLAR